MTSQGVVSRLRWGRLTLCQGPAPPGRQPVLSRQLCCAGGERSRGAAAMTNLGLYPFSQDTLSPHRRACLLCCASRGWRLEEMGSRAGLSRFGGNLAAPGWLAFVFAAEPGAQLRLRLRIWRVPLRGYACVVRLCVRPVPRAHPQPSCLHFPRCQHACIADATTPQPESREVGERWPGLSSTEVWMGSAHRQVTFWGWVPPSPQCFGRGVVCPPYLAPCK